MQLEDVVLLDMIVQESNQCTLVNMAVSFLGWLKCW